MLIYAIISLYLHGEADVFPGSWRTYKRFLLSLCRLTIVLAFKSIAIVFSI